MVCAVEPGAIVAGKFELVRELGRGGMGSVWLATRIDDGDPCAVKVMGEDIAHVESMRARFEREAQALEQLDSPHVVRLLDHGVWDKRRFIAMELLEGESLRSRLDRDGKLPVRDVMSVARACALGLEAIHAADIVHRDLKPSNIFLLDDGGVRICDLGVAKAEDDTGLQTRSGSLLGTPHYMSPEQMDSPRTVDARADVWALAVIVYECLTGARPFDAEQLSKLINAVVTSQSAPPSKLAALPPDVDEWWRRATAVKLQDRYATAPALVADLEEALHSGGVASSRWTGGLVVGALAAIGIVVALASTGDSGGIPRVALGSSVPSPSVAPTREVALSGSPSASPSASVAGTATTASPSNSPTPVSTMASSGGKDSTSPGVAGSVRPRATGSRPSADGPPPASPARCASDCAEFGFCKLAEGRCVARSDADCQASQSCKNHGSCTMSGDKCVKSEAGCASSWDCGFHGTCSFGDGRCVATSAAKCAASGGCRKGGSCSLVRGACRAGSTNDCTQSQRCKEHGYCTFRGEICVR